MILWLAYEALTLSGENQLRRIFKTREGGEKFYHAQTLPDGNNRFALERYDEDKDGEIVLNYGPRRKAYLYKGEAFYQRELERED